MALVNPQTGKRTEAQCDGSRQIPFATGYLPQDEEGCFFQRLEGIFGVGGGKAPAPASSTISD
jgi:penicillin-binding protein 1B